ncbi:DUF6368 family protein [Streptomyces inhibens]|uniref:DUF6368 family protein n=1 Tax=Streptomyces inhibens TaxID=2293571 RepID=UPI0036AA9CA0
MTSCARNVHGSPSTARSHPCVSSQGPSASLRPPQDARTPLPLDVADPRNERLLARGSKSDAQTEPVCQILVTAVVPGVIAMMTEPLPVEYGTAEFLRSWAQQPDFRLLA